MALTDLISRIGSNPLTETMRNLTQGPEDNLITRQKESRDILRQLQRRMDQPIELNVEDNPIYRAAQKQTQAEAEAASRRAMEELNTRNILPSTVTSDRLAQIQQRAAAQTANIIPQLYQQELAQRQRDISNLANLYNISQQREQSAYSRQFQEEQAAAQAETARRKSQIDDAMRRIEFNNGVVDRQSSIILGIPEGRMTRASRERVEDRRNQLLDQQREFERQQQMARLQSQLTGERQEATDLRALERAKQLQEMQSQSARELESIRQRNRFALQQSKRKADKEELSDYEIKKQAANLATRLYEGLGGEEEYNQYVRSIEDYLRGGQDATPPAMLNKAMGSLGSLGNILGSFVNPGLGATNRAIQQQQEQTRNPFAGIEDYLR